MRGQYTADGTAKQISTVADYVWITNGTTGKQYYWQRGMKQGTAIQSGSTLIATNGVSDFYNAGTSSTKTPIISITKATQAVVGFTDAPKYVVGQILQFVVPAEFGMTQINGLQGQIVSVDLTAKTVTVDIDSTNFTAFAVPEVPKGIAQVLAVGIAILCDEIQGDFTQGSMTTAGLTFGTSVAGADGDLVFWIADTMNEKCAC